VENRNRMIEEKKIIEYRILLFLYNLACRSKVLISERWLCCVSKRKNIESRRGKYIK
jgi:hypothetical protein